MEQLESLCKNLWADIQDMVQYDHHIRLLVKKALYQFKRFRQWEDSHDESTSDIQNEYEYCLGLENCEFSSKPNEFCINPLQSKGFRQFMKIS